MARTEINDDAIWVKNIDAGADLRERLLALAPGEAIDLEVDGIVGKWERMKRGKDGRPVNGIKPVAEMRQVWARLREQGRRVVSIREVVLADTYLAALPATMGEWDSPEDDEAYRDL